MWTYELAQCILELVINGNALLLLADDYLVKEGQEIGQAQILAIAFRHLYLLLKELRDNFSDLWHKVLELYEANCLGALLI